MKRNQPIFFKKKLSADFYNGAPNATFVRDLGVVDFDPVCEIDVEGHKWIVRYSEIETQEEAVVRMKDEWMQKIGIAKMGIKSEKKTKTAIAAVLDISTQTLRKRMKWLGV